MDNKIISQLRSSIVRGRLAHAYLFSGPTGSGKKETAKTLAKILNCELKGADSCGLCSSCKKIENNSHPDVRWILPGGDSDSIKIEDIRNLQREISMKPYEGRYKVYTIIDADTMTEEAANCLLKTLEEPPGDALLILTSSNIKMLLSTIVSRCQVVKFPSMLGSEEGTQKNEVIDMFLELGEEPKEKLWFFDKERPEIEDALYIIERWFRDILVLKCGASGSLLMNQDRKEEIKELSKGYSQEGLLNILNTIGDTRLVISQNANIKIAIPVMLMKINKERRNAI